MKYSHRLQWVLICFLGIELCGYIYPSSYKNIIFDLGGVILKGGHDYSGKKSEDSADLHCIKVCGSKAWKNWHRGRLTKEALIRRLSQSFDQKDVELVVAEALSPERSWIEETISFIKRLKNAGYRLFLLSNLSREAYELYIPLNDIFSYFDGMMFSFEVGYIKPDQNMYKHLLKTYDLNPRASIFIDDKKINIDAAKKLGITGIQYSSGTLEKAFQKIGISLDLKSETKIKIIA